MPSGVASGTLCDDANVQVHPHFENPNVPVPTFADPVTAQVGNCGDLTFDDRTRTFTVKYATDSAEPNESPWKYWWRRGRRADNGAGEGLEQVRRVSIPASVQDSVTIDMPLDDQWDAVGLVLLITDDSTLVINHSAFIDGSGPLFNPQNIQVQHWAHLAAPTLDSVTVNGNNVTVWWRNEHNGRTIDSTIVYRNDSQRCICGPNFTSYEDVDVAPGTYDYTVKHVSRPAVPQGYGVTPNSASPSPWQVVVLTTPPPLAMQIDGTDWITTSANYTWEMDVTDGETPYTPFLWEYKPFGGSYTTVGTSISYSRFVYTTDDWFWLRAAVWDAEGDSVVNRKIAVETSGGGGGEAAPEVGSFRRGVRLSDGSCSPRPAPGTHGRQEWLQMIMETVERIEYCRVDDRNR